MSFWQKQYQFTLCQSTAAAGGKPDLTGTCFSFILLLPQHFLKTDILGGCLVAMPYNLALNELKLQEKCRGAELGVAGRRACTPPTGSPLDCWVLSSLRVGVSACRPERNEHSSQQNISNHHRMGPDLSLLQKFRIFKQINKKRITYLLHFKNS